MFGGSSLSHPPPPQSSPLREGAPSSLQLKGFLSEKPSCDHFPGTPKPRFSPALFQAASNRDGPALAASWDRESQYNPQRRFAQSQGCPVISLGNPPCCQRGGVSPAGGWITGCVYGPDSLWPSASSSFPPGQSGHKTLPAHQAGV